MKKLQKDIFGFSKATVGLGVGTMVVSGVAAKSTGTSGLTEGMATAAGFMPIVGTAMMGKHALKSVKKLKF